MIRDQLLAAVQAALDACGFPAPSTGIELTPPKDSDHGDFTTNVALQLAKPLGMAPRDIAARIAEELDRARPGHLDRVEIAGHGFLNLYLSPTWLHEVLVAVVAQGERYGHGEALDGLRINLEFVSANPTGPLHAGGGRWVAVGDALANLLAAQGAVVHREYYLNDAGNQLDTFAASLFARYEGREPPEDGYQGQYLIDMAAVMRAELGDAVTEEQAQDWGYRYNVRTLQDDLARIGVHFDTWFSERTLHEAGKVKRALDDLGARGVVFDARRRHLAAHHRLRRPARPRPGEVRRVHHLPVQRHRVPPRQVRARVGAPRRHLGRRPPRAGEVAPSRDGGARLPGG